MEIHLEIIESFRANAHWVEEYYRGDAEWELVKFYSYNRYFIERERVWSSLSRASESCFTLKDIEVSRAELKQVHKAHEICQLAEEVAKHNLEARR